MFNLTPYCLSIFLLLALCNVSTASKESEDKYLEISSTAPKKYHINLKAPIFLQKNGQKLSLSPTSINDKKFLLKLYHPDNTSSYQLHFFLCNDTSTVCEKNSYQISWNQTLANFEVAPLLQNIHGFVEVQLRGHSF